MPTAGLKTSKESNPSLPILGISLPVPFEVRGLATKPLKLIVDEIGLIVSINERGIRAMLLCRQGMRSLFDNPAEPARFCPFRWRDASIARSLMVASTILDAAKEVFWWRDNAKKRAWHRRLILSEEVFWYRAICRYCWGKHSMSSCFYPQSSAYWFSRYKLRKRWQMLYVYEIRDNFRSYYYQ